MSRYLVTSALPYANGPLHLGHLAGAYLPADIYVRFLRMQREDVKYICGTDEHGVPITIKAEQLGITPKEAVDRFHEVIARDFQRFGISFDNFSRTEKPEHYRFAQEVFLDLLEKGYIVEKSMKQFHCDRCSRFLPDRYVGGTCPQCGSANARGDQCDDCGSWLEALELLEPLCSICGSTPVPRDTTHWFLRLDAFQEWIEQWLAGHPDWKGNVLNYCRGWMDEGLRERAITRDLDWGVPVPVPGAEGKVLYVWFEALLGYVSSTREYFRNIGDPEGWKRYWLDPETRLVQFIGKDNIVFHAVIQPAVLHGLGGYVLPWNIPANEYLNIKGEKFSTSRGTAVWLNDYLAYFPPDPMRYALAINAPENRDTDFSWDEFRARNNELADVFGNFINRIMKFAHRTFDGMVPAPGEAGEAESQLMSSARATRDEVEDLIRGFSLKTACLRVMELAREGNRYFDQSQPWKTAKTDRESCATTIYYSLQLADALRILFAPYIPFTCERTGKMLGREALEWKEAGCENLKPGDRLGRPEILLEKLETGFETVIYDDAAPETTKKAPEGSPDVRETVPYEEFMKMDMRVGVVTEVHEIKGADKLFRLLVDLGDHVRQLVAGMKPYYTAEELTGRRVVVLVNLQPVKIRGVESNGMVLASDDGKGRVRLLQPADDAIPGDGIH
ncbi:MAG: methionine--tRNA ligase [Candidatus Fermentibacteraceae bacterium]|nr:methionine--tRNA ligase [Candidatus Fermentibacteraceae bacterium]MBN2607540.1 methionine--tRNA ligase [Candidatus Fermentibacteraceae bacterium]